MSSNSTHDGADLYTGRHIRQGNEQGSCITPASSIDGNESDVVRETQGNKTTSGRPGKHAASDSDSLASHHTGTERVSHITGVHGVRAESNEDLPRYPYQEPYGMSKAPSPNLSSTQQLDEGQNSSPLARANNEDVKSEQSRVSGQQRTPVSHSHRMLTDLALENNYRVLPLVIGCIIPVSVKDINYDTKSTSKMPANTCAMPSY